jgi:hypothetical protein
MWGTDPRYKHVRSIWNAGDLQSFSEIFSIIPKSIVSDDLGLNYGRFSKKVHNPELLIFREIILLSELTGVDLQYIVELIVADISARSNAKKK